MLSSDGRCSQVMADDKHAASKLEERGDDDEKEEEEELEEEIGEMIVNVFM